MHWVYTKKPNKRIIKLLSHIYKCLDQDKLVSIWIFSIFPFDNNSDNAYRDNYQSAPSSMAANKVYAPPLPVGGIDVVFFGKVIVCPDHP